MKHLIRLFTLMLSAGLLLQAPLSAADPANTKPLAVWFYADWCTNCKLLAPKYAPARSGLEDQIQFVTLDLTNEETKAKAKEIAKNYGISPLYYANQATGWVALVDVKHVKVGELHNDQSVEEMHAALEKLAQGS
jgi:thiol-disulfide isomerase/thioredoxin